MELALAADVKDGLLLVLLDGAAVALQECAAAHCHHQPEPRIACSQPMSLDAQAESSLQDARRLHRILSSAVKGTRPLVRPVRKGITTDACWDRQSLVAEKRCLRDIMVLSHELGHTLSRLGYISPAEVLKSPCSSGS